MSEKIISNPSGYDMPKPTRFLILDDLSDGNQDTINHLQELSSLVDSRNQTVLASTSHLESRLGEKYRVALNNGSLPNPSITIGIGNAGMEIAKNIKVDTQLVQVNATRSKKEDGTNFIGTKSGIPLEDEIHLALAANNILPTEEEQTIVLVDDTIFGGTTLRSIVEVLEQSFPNAHFIALTLTYIPSRARAELNELENLKIIAGLALRGHHDEEEGLNSIDARDFIEDEALRLEGGISIPFSEEENWMRSWFGENYDAALEICQNLRRQVRNS